MKRRVRLIEHLILLVLGLLVILAMVWPEVSTFRTGNATIEISAIIRENDATSWASTRLGMEQAAYDLGVYLRFLTPSQGNDAQEQETLLLREAERGSNALVVMPVNTQALSELLTQGRLFIPLISLESQIEGTAGSVHLDNVRVGALLAEAALEDGNAESILLLNLTPENSGISLRISEAQKTLEQAGVAVQVCDKERLEQEISEGSTAAVLCFEPYATLYAANLIEGSDKAVMLYGVGASSRMIAALEHGTVQALVVWDEYIAGYLSVQQAVLAAKKKTVESSKLSVSIIRRSDIYEMENQKRLFPVTK